MCVSGFSRKPFSMLHNQTQRLRTRNLPSFCKPPFCPEYWASAVCCLKS